MTNNHNNIKPAEKCPSCLAVAEDCFCGLMNLINHKVHEKGTLYCIKDTQGKYMFVLAMENKKKGQLLTHEKDRLANKVVFYFNDKFPHVRGHYDAQLAMAKEHAHLVLQKAGG